MPEPEEIIKYHVYDPDAGAEAVDAKDIIHAKANIDPNVPRGLPPFFRYPPGTIIRTEGDRDLCYIEPEEVPMNRSEVWAKAAEVSLKADLETPPQMVRLDPNNIPPGTIPCVHRACQIADAMLAEFDKRFPSRWSEKFPTATAEQVKDLLKNPPSEGDPPDVVQG